MLDFLQPDLEAQLAYGSPLGRPDDSPWTIFLLLAVGMAV